MKLRYILLGLLIASTTFDAMILADMYVTGQDYSYQLSSSFCWLIGGAAFLAVIWDYE